MQRDRPKPRLFGIETEYGIVTIPRAGRTTEANRMHASSLLLDLVRQRHPHLPDGGQGIFLANAARFYLDTGMHPEMSTAECSDPLEAVCHVRAGERILAGSADALSTGDRQVILLRTNVDYTTGAGWGCHENQLHQTSHTELQRHLVSHLISRIILTGGGGFDALAPGIVFALSPRVAYMYGETSSHSEGTRGILDYKDEPLATRGFQRLHLLCGESVCSDMAVFLKVGTTALVVALIELGVNIGDAVGLREPVSAMRRFAHDPFCRATALTRSGRELTAIQIQRHYLERAEANLASLPAWAPLVCRHWRAVLDRLERGAPDTVATTLDWAIKFALFNEHVRRRGFTWEALAAWSQAMKNAGMITRLYLEDHPEKGDFLLGANPLSARAKEKLKPLVERSDLCWDDLGGVLALRQELFEIDARFGQLGGRAKSIFDRLDEGQLLDHRLVTAEQIDRATREPPALGRARLRGEHVRNFAGANGRYRCDWTAVIDREQGAMLDLSDPFATEATWKELPRPLPRHLPGPTHEDVLALYDAGKYEDAFRLLTRLEQAELHTHRAQTHLRFRAWVQARRGFPDAVAALDEMTRGRQHTMSDIADYVCVHRYLGIAPPPATEEWVRKGYELGVPDTGNGTKATFLGHVGYTHLRRGRVADALRVLEEACETCSAAHPHVVSRLYAELGDAHRALGHRAESLRWLRESAQLERQHGFEGDLADFTFTYRAKNAAGERAALGWLNQAKEIQRRLGNRMGEARTLLLEARLSGRTGLSPLVHARLLELRNERPALRDCALFAKVLDRWDAWTDGALEPDETGDVFWGV